MPENHAMKIDVIFIDSGRWPQVKPDPKYPEGMTMNLLQYPSQKGCTINVPYPAPRCGMYMLNCNECDMTVALTVAGRIDDPRVVTIPCGRKDADVS